MRIVVLHQQVEDQALASELDVLCQVQAIAKTLEQLGHRVSVLSCSLDLAKLRDELNHLRPAMVFNLVESLADTDRLMPLVPMLLDGLGIPYSGSPAATILTTNDKVESKRLLTRAGLPTPAWFSPHSRCQVENASGDTMLVRGRRQRMIIKSIWEHASRGISGDSIVETNGSLSALRLAVRQREKLVGLPCFAEQYIDGRELNVSLLGHSNGPLLLPPAEIEFLDFGACDPKIVGHDAKWVTDSFEYRHTPRRFDFSDDDGPLLERVSELSIRCWHAFHLRGYARVDFRVDGMGQPWILEINSNPCLSADAGFAAAVRHAGMSYETMIQFILEDAHPAVGNVARPRRPVHLTG